MVSIFIFSPYLVFYFCIFVHVRIVFFRLIWPHFDCIEGIFVFLASFCHFGLMKWPFPYESRPYFLLYCPAAQTGAKSGYSALKSSYIELSFLYVRHYCQTLATSMYKNTEKNTKKFKEKKIQKKFSVFFSVKFSVNFSVFFSVFFFNIQIWSSNNTCKKWLKYWKK